jgi:hypothetical protein
MAGSAHQRVTNKFIPRLMLSWVVAVVGVGCGGGSGSSGSNSQGGPPPSAPPPPPTASLQVYVLNVLNEPIEGATVAVDVGGLHAQAITRADGSADFTDLPTGPANLSVSADGFESEAGASDLAIGQLRWNVMLRAIGAWAAGRAIVMGTEVLARANDGSRMTFAVDVAVVSGENPEPLETLTDADFRLLAYDCGWFGPRGCASDAAGNATAGGGAYSLDGLTRAFELRPAPGRQPYLVGVLAQRSGSGTEWGIKGPALESFFETLGGNDAIGLASVQVENGTATLTAIGPFTNDGSMYLGAIEALGNPAGDPPSLEASLLDSIRWTAAARDSDFPGRDATVLALSATGLSVEEIDDAVALARLSNVHISVIGEWSWGLPEIAVRTGGFVVELDDLRQYAIAFGTMDRVLGGEVPYYRMQFELMGAPGVFVQGGNVKVPLHIDLPAPVPNGGIYADLDVAIP